METDKLVVTQNTTLWELMLQDMIQSALNMSHSMFASDLKIVCWEKQALLT